jgi:hypothetical protein
MQQNPNSPQIVEDSQIGQTSQPAGEFQQAPILAKTTAKETLMPLYTAESGLTYPEQPIVETKAREHLVLDGLPIEITVPDVDLLPPEGFTKIRRVGFGGSDSGVLLGVNPYTKIDELILQKATPTITAEEAAIGEQTAVLKGKDLEPLVIYKFQKLFDMQIIKPTDMYRYKDYPYLTMNFDGVTGHPGSYIPVEIKIVTARGERHYNPWTCIYLGSEGFKPLPPHHELNNNSIETKANLFGIPPYYYTQLQDEMMALNAPFGYLCTLWERTWELHIYLIYRDNTVQNALRIQGFKAWDKVETLRAKNGFYQKFNTSTETETVDQ